MPTRILNAAPSWPLIVLLFLGPALPLPAQSPFPSPGSAAFYQRAAKLEEVALQNFEPQTSALPIPQTRPLATHPFRGLYPWKLGIVTELFWAGQPASGISSAWDPQWQRHYGGIDNPKPSARHNYIPTAFTPGQNPFYCELPYNDVTDSGTKPEAPLVIPWFHEAYTKYGQSVCQNRWVEIRDHTGRTCYAQWSDCGPIGTTDWQYVFGNEHPVWNIDKGAGLGVSPAVRDYLGLREMDVTSWRFVEFQDVPAGPWSNYGANNDFLIRPHRFATN